MCHPPTDPPARTPKFTTRLIGVILLLGAVTLFWIAASLTPSPDGLGTHRALGMPSCGWISAMDLPCPTCGMTTAYSHAVRGQLLRSLLAQPMGFLLALATLGGGILGGWMVWTGAALHERILDRWTMRWTWWIIAVTLAAWGYKILAWKGLI